MYDRKFLVATGERAVGMFAGTLSSALFVDGTDLFHVPWQSGLGTATGAALLSVLTSIAKAHVGPEGPGVTETTRGAGRDEAP